MPRRLRKNAFDRTFINVQHFSGGSAATTVEGRCRKVGSLCRPSDASVEQRRSAPEVELRTPQLPLWSQQIVYQSRALCWNLTNNTRISFSCCTTLGPLGVASSRGSQKWLMVDSKDSTLLSSGSAIVDKVLPLWSRKKTSYHTADDDPRCLSESFSFCKAQLE